MFRVPIPYCIEFLRLSRSRASVVIHVDSHYSYIIFADDVDIRLVKQIPNTPYAALDEHIINNFAAMVESLLYLADAENFSIAGARIQTCLPASLVMRHVLPAEGLQENELDDYVGMQLAQIMPGYAEGDSQSLYLDYRLIFVDGLTNRLEIVICEKRIIDALSAVCEQHKYVLESVGVDVLALTDRLLLNSLLQSDNQQQVDVIMYFSSDRVWFINRHSDDGYYFEDLILDGLVSSDSDNSISVQIAMHCLKYAGGRPEAFVLLAGNWHPYINSVSELQRSINKNCAANWCLDMDYVTRLSRSKAKVTVEYAAALCLLSS